MLNGYIDPIFLHTSAKTQPTTIPTSHVIAIFVPETNMHPKLGICIEYQTSTSWDCTHITEWIWLQHSKYSSLLAYYIGIQTWQFWTFMLKHTQLEAILHMLLPNMCQKQICPKTVHIYHICKLLMNILVCIYICMPQMKSLEFCTDSKQLHHWWQQYW